MPIYQRIDSKGKYFFQYGNHGKKYYFTPSSKLSKLSAYKKALKQTAAAHANK